MILIRALARLVTFLLLLALALAGLAVAVFSIRGGDRPLSLPALADNVRLPQLRNTVGDYLGQLEGPGNIALISLLAGLAAILLGLLLLLGALRGSRERLVIVDRTGGGVLAARRRALGQMAVGLAEQARGVVGAKARVRTSRRGRGKLRLTVTHPRDSAPAEVRGATTDALQPLSSGFGVKSKVRSKLGDAGQRVQ